MKQGHLVSNRHNSDVLSASRYSFSSVKENNESSRVNPVDSRNLKLLQSFLGLKDVKQKGWLQKLKGAYQVVQRLRIEKEKGLKSELELSDLEALIHEDDLHKSPNLANVKPEHLLSCFQFLHSLLSYALSIQKSERDLVANEDILEFDKFVKIVL